MELLHAMTIESTVPDNLYEELVDLYGDSIYRFCRSLTYSREDAEDLYQETFMRAFEQLPKIRATGNPQGFLFSMALNLWRSWTRKYARRRRLVPTEPLREDMAADNPPEESYLAQEEALVVRELVNALPEKYRIPTLLYYSVEMGVSDIAATLKLPNGTVKSRLYKARKLVEKGLIAVYDKT